MTRQVEGKFVNYFFLGGYLYYKTMGNGWGMWFVKWILFTFERLHNMNIEISKILKEFVILYMPSKTFVTKHRGCERVGKSLVQVRKAVLCGCSRYLSANKTPVVVLYWESTFWREIFQLRLMGCSGIQWCEECWKERTMWRYTWRFKILLDLLIVGRVVLIKHLYPNFIPCAWVWNVF